MAATIMNVVIRDWEVVSRWTAGACAGADWARIADGQQLQAAPARILGAGQYLLGIWQPFRGGSHTRRRQPSPYRVSLRRQQLQSSPLSYRSSGCRSRRHSPEDRSRSAISGRCRPACRSTKWQQSSLTFLPRTLPEALAALETDEVVAGRLVRRFFRTFSRSSEASWKPTS